MADISKLPVPPQATRTQDISNLPPPPKSAVGLPPPPTASIANLPPPPGQQDTYAKIRQETDKPLLQGLAESPVLKSEFIEPNEIEAIARKHNVSAQDLRGWLPFLGGNIRLSEASVGDWAKAAAGMAGNIALGIPQKIAKSIQTPEMERALDDLQELSRARKSLVAAGVENLALPGAATVGRTVGQAARSGAALGAAAGAAGSRQDEELTGALAGGTLGGVLGAGVGAISNKLAARSAKEAAGVERIAANPDLRTGINREVAANAKADNALAEQIFSDATELTPAQAAEIASSKQSLIDKMLTEGTDENEAFLSKLSKRGEVPEDPDTLRSIATQEVAQLELDQVATRLSREVGIPNAEDPIAALRSWAGLSEGSGQGIDAARRRLMESQRTQHALRFLDESGLQVASDSTLAARAADAISDVQYVLRAYDEKFPGIELEDVHKRLNRGVNHMSYPREEFRAQLNDIYKANLRDGVDQLAADASAIINKVENKQPLTPQEERAFSGFRKYFSDGLKKLNDIADEYEVDRIGIKERENYIPAQLVDTYQLQNIMEDRISALVRDARAAAPNIDIKSLADIPEDVYTRVVGTNPEHKSTMQFLRMLSAVDSERPQDLNRAFVNVFQNRQGRLRLETVARAALQREDMIPLWARETNLYKLADKWQANTLRHMFLRRPIDELRGRARILENMGATREAAYIERLIADLMGIRQGTAAESFNVIQKRFMQNLDKLIARAPEGSVQRAALVTAKTLPTLMQEQARSVYPNLLGALNPRTLVMNLTQTFTKTLPELGGPYGSALFLRSAAGIRGLKNLPEAARQMKLEGLMPAEFVGGNLNYLSEGLARSGVVDYTQRALARVADLGMRPYQWAETANRAIAWGAGRMMANDLIKGSKLAVGALNRFPESVRFAARDLLAAGNQEQLGKLLSEHLVNSTQYQYNRASMSEYGRTMGPLFSTFSKWPTATAGQIIEGYRSKGALRGSTQLAEQLVAPFLLLEAADWAMGQANAWDDAEGTDVQKKLFSREGLSQAAPIGNIKGIVTGDFFSPPVIDTAMKVIQALGTEDKAAALEKAASNGLYMFAPGGLGGWIRFVTDDVATLATGQRPEGSSFLERTQEGWRQITK